MSRKNRHNLNSEIVRSKILEFRTAHDPRHHLSVSLKKTDDEAVFRLVIGFCLRRIIKNGGETPEKNSNPKFLGVLTHGFFKKGAVF